MTVLVQMNVKAPDAARFIATAEKYAPRMAELGATNGGVFEDENEPGLMNDHRRVGEPRCDDGRDGPGRRDVQRRRGHRGSRVGHPHLGAQGRRVADGPRRRQRFSRATAALKETTGVNREAVRAVDASIGLPLDEFIAVSIEGPAGGRPRHRPVSGATSPRGAPSLRSADALAS